MSGPEQSCRTPVDAPMTVRRRLSLGGKPHPDRAGNFALGLGRQDRLGNQSDPGNL